MKLFDPTSTPRERTVTLAPRPRDLAGLRVGLVENTKFNSDVILTKLGERLALYRGGWFVPYPPIPAVVLLPFVAIRGSRQRDDDAGGTGGGGAEG